MSTPAPRHLVGDVRIVADPAAAYAEVVVGALAATASRPFRLGISGGASGERCLRALIAAGLAWSEVAVFFADERRVPQADPQSNAGSLAAVLGELVPTLAGWYPMDPDAGPEAYETVLRAEGPLDLLQLGFGPDGHTASLFPGSPALAAPGGQLVADNRDLTGRNPLARITLTLEGIASARTVVMVVSGAEKHDALAAILAGEDLPSARVRAPRLIWLIEEAAAAGLEDELVTTSP